MSDRKPTFVELIEAFDLARAVFFANHKRVHERAMLYTDWDDDMIVYAVAAKPLNDRLLAIGEYRGVAHRGNVYRWGSVIPQVVEDVRTAAAIDGEKGGEV